MGSHDVTWLARIKGIELNTLSFIDPKYVFQKQLEIIKNGINGLIQCKQ
jgi:hypothetical protein